MEPFEQHQESGIMDDSGPCLRKWEEMNTDILVKIFQYFDIVELISGKAHVCRAWRQACCDLSIWRTLDLSTMKHNFIKIPMEPYVYVDTESDRLLTRIMKISSSLNCGQMETLIFHYNLYVSDAQLSSLLRGTPLLKRLVLPSWNRITRSGIRSAFRSLKNLESLTMPSIANPTFTMEDLARNCKKFRELKIMGPCDYVLASNVVAYLPNLKVLSLRCSLLHKAALTTILDYLSELEVLNISHCLLIDDPPPPQPKRIIKTLDQSIFEKASHLKEFLTCMDDKCIMCQRTRNDEGLMRWYRYEEWQWKKDEVRSLAL